MDRNTFLALAGAALFCGAGAAAATVPVSSDERDKSSREEIERIERDRNQAVLRGDAAALDRMTSDDYMFVTQRGELRTKAEILTGFKSGASDTRRGKSRI
jgi:ketosteroid isomerase-like protein